MRKKQFSDFSFQNFFGFWEKIFSDFRPKNVKNLSKLPSTCPEEQFVAWNFLRFESFPIFCRNHWHGSQISIYVSRVEIAEETGFWFFFADFFRILRAKFFRLSAKTLQKFSKLSSTCPAEQFVAWNSSAWFSKFYLRVQSKNFGRNSFLIFLFRIFSDFERNFFPTFGEKSSKSCHNYLLRV